MLIPFDDIDKLSARRLADLERAWRSVLLHPRSCPDVIDDRNRQPRSTGTRSLPEALPDLLILSGASRSGKDYLAGVLAEEYAGIRIHAYSSPLINEVNAALRWHGLRITEGNKSLAHNRHLLQAWGLARRELDPEYWLEHLRGLLRRSYSSPEIRLVVLSGARTHSDLRLATEYPATIWRIRREDNDYISGHEIETMAASLPADKVVTLPKIDRAVAKRTLEQLLGHYRSN